MSNTLPTMSFSQLEEENWNLKAELIRTRQALMQYQGKEIQENLQRIADERSAAANATSGAQQ